jgi:hypothetical protein
VKVLLGVDADINVKLIVQVDVPHLVVENALVDVGRIVIIVVFSRLAVEECALEKIVPMLALMLVKKLVQMTVKMLVKLNAKPAVKALVEEAAQEDVAAVQISALAVVALVRTDVLKSALENVKNNVSMLKCSQLVI